MLKNKLLFYISIITILFSYPDEPPNGKSGAPGEGTCADCHNSYDLNSGTGSISILNVPENYEINETYTLSVEITHPSQIRWGFELSAKLSDGNQGGTIIISESGYTQFSLSDNNITYIKQNLYGTYNGQSGPVVWSFDWISPISDQGDITFYVSGLAANGNGNKYQDYVYTTSSNISPNILIYGCMDITACNYNEAANTEDDCTYAEEYYDCNSNCINDQDNDLICDELEIEGCTDSNALNFNENATDDNGTCEYQENISNLVIPHKTNLDNPFPNPFNPYVIIPFSIKDVNNIHIGIYSLNGKLIKILLQESITTGYHSISWNAGMYPSGIYLIKLISEKNSITKKIILMK